MAETAKNTCYEGCGVSDFHFYLEKSNEHGKFSSSFMMSCLGNLKGLEQVKAAWMFSVLEVVEVGQIDVQMLSLLQSAFPAAPITADIVEGSLELTDNFKALVAKKANLQRISFSWHITPSEGYEKQVKAKGELKKFDFIHMIQMIYYVDSLADTIKFFHGLLKPNGRLMIIVEAANSGSDILWKTYAKELCVCCITEYRSSGEVAASLKNQGLKYEEHSIPNSFDITECFDPSSKPGEHLLSFMTGTSHFSQSFSPEVRAGILDLLRTKCSTEKDGKILFNSNLTCFLVHA